MLEKKNVPRRRPYFFPVQGQALLSLTKLGLTHLTLVFLASRKHFYFRFSNIVLNCLVCIDEDPYLRTLLTVLNFSLDGVVI